MRFIELGEYRSATIDIDSDLCDRLIDVAGPRLDVRVARHGRVEIRANSNVGVISVDDLVIRVRPKVPLANLFHMLGVDTSTWTWGKDASAFGAGSDDLAAATVALFARSVETLCAWGLQHGYVAQEERLSGIRGRVDMTASMRRSWERSPIPCRFDEFVPDIFENQALFAGIAAARKVPGIPGRLGAHLRLLEDQFAAVRRRSITQAQIMSWKPNRSTRRYRTAMTLVGILLGQRDLIDRDRDVTAASFTLDMNVLFERYIITGLARRSPEPLLVGYQHGMHLDRGRRVAVAADLVVTPRSGGPPVLVGDTKYKLNDGVGKASDHYQLLAYATILGLDHGVLIYCDGGADSGSGSSAGDPVTTIDVVGNKQRHHVYRFDLSGSRTELESRLDALGEYLWKLVPVPAAPPLLHQVAGSTA